MDDRFPYNTPKYSNIPFMHIVSLTHLDFPPKKSWNNYTIFHLVCLKYTNIPNHVKKKQKNLQQKVSPLGFNFAACKKT